MNNTMPGSEEAVLVNTPYPNTFYLHVLYLLSGGRE